jgi:D-alanyl-D-alanine carboxypeptidase
MTSPWRSPIGGTEEEFARIMTRRAHALGMTHTTYVNASGLPNDTQITTARDLALLARAVQNDFPKYYRYFSTLNFQYHSMSIRNHNHLLGRSRVSTESRPATPAHRGLTLFHRCIAATAESSRSSSAAPRAAHVMHACAA